jgi:hypothetical protein
MEMDRSSMAANTLVVTLAAILPLWVFGLEQVVPPFILMAGLVAILLGGGRLRVPPTAWVFLVVLLITLLSLSRISGFRSLVFFARGHLVLVAGLVALVLAANAGSTRVGLERVIKGFVVFTLLVTAMMTGYFLGLLPEYFEVPFKGIFGEAFEASDYFQGNILWRKIAVQESPLVGVSISRVSTVFLYPTLSGAVMPPLLTFSLAGLYVLPKGWRVWCWLAAGGAVAGVLATGGRSAILFTGTILLAAAAWRVVGSRRGPAVLISVAATVLIAVVLMLWLPVGDSVVWKKLVLEYRAYSAQGRVEVYIESIGRLLERPLFGWGTQELVSQKGWTYLRLGTHSELLNMAYRFGLVGLLGYLAVGATFGIWYVQRLAHLRSKSGESRRVDAMVLMGIGVAATASNALLHMVQWDVNVYWISLSLVGLVHALGTGPGPLASHASPTPGAE